MREKTEDYADRIGLTKLQLSFAGAAANRVLAARRALKWSFALLFFMEEDEDGVLPPLPCWCCGLLCCCRGYIGLSSRARALCLGLLELLCPTRATCFSHRTREPLQFRKLARSLVLSSTFASHLQLGRLLRFKLF